jgi:hypothetical protein
MTRSTFVVAAALSTGACAPVFSDLQSAHTLPKDAYEVTAHGSASWFASKDQSAHVQNHLGIQLGGGLSDRVEMRVRYERVEVDGDGDGDGGGGVNLLAGGPKLALVPDRLALSLPVGLAFAEGGRSSLHAQPGLVATVPVLDALEVNPSLKYTFPLDDSEGFRGLGLNLGLGIGRRTAPVVLRPEAGVMFAPDGVRYYHATLGISVRSGKR